MGNTGSRRGGRSRSSVHPHACGEHTTNHTQQHAGTGSSPRMWGTPGAAGPIRGCRRFIPTHVGNTLMLEAYKDNPPVHPHACGEHGVHFTRRAPLHGSSPRMWGTLNKEYAAMYNTRFIPTHVGNTLRCYYQATL